MDVVRRGDEQHVGLVLRQQVFPDTLAVAGIDRAIGKILGEPSGDATGRSAFFTAGADRTNINADIRHRRGEMAHADARQRSADATAHEVLETLADDVVEKHSAADDGDLQAWIGCRHGNPDCGW